MTNSTTEPDGEAGNDRNVTDFTQNYYNQHRNVMIFSLLLMFIDVSGAKLKDSVDSTIGGGLSFSGELDISLIFLFLLCYSYLYFVAEWLWQAKPQYELGVNELKALSLRIEHEILPLRNQVARNSGEFREALSEIRELSNLQPGESLSSAEEKAWNIMDGVESQISLINGMIDRVFIHAPRGYVVEYNGSFQISTGEFSKEDLEADFEHIINEFVAVKNEISRIENDIKWVQSEHNVVLDMFKKRAKASISEFDSIVSSLLNIAEKYDHLGFPKKIKNRSKATNILSNILAWGFGFWMPTSLFGLAVIVHLFDPLRISMASLIVKQPI